MRNLGNRLEAKLNKPQLVHWMCYKTTSTWFPLWIDLNMFMPIGVDCWIDNIRLVYNRTTRRASNSHGVQVRVISTPWWSIGSCWATPRNETVRGAPYDWRLARMKTQSTSTMLQELVQDMYEQYQEPVYLLGHSMGSSGWKDRYIRGFISLGAPWGGAVKTLRVMASGENDGIPMSSNIKIREEQRMTTTNPWMLPSEEAWSKDHVFISTPTFNYTNRDYERFFKDIDFEDGCLPVLEVWCMYGVGLPTPVTYIYDKGYPNTDPVDFVTPTGTDTVDSFSMSLCKRWGGAAGAAGPRHRVHGGCLTWT
uniref:Lecithin-cholesterol acyltransferase n=1 Tax=Sphaeramia orbicularis TaxID=375764 RepID=A0A673AKT9_9TELE